MLYLDVHAMDAPGERRVDSLSQRHGGPRSALKEHVVEVCRELDASFILFDGSARAVTAMVSSRRPTVLYVREERGRFACSNSLRLIANLEPRAALDPSVVWFLVSNTYVPSPNTIFKGVYKLPAGMRFDYSLAPSGESRLEAYVGSCFTAHLDRKLEAYRKSEACRPYGSKDEIAEALWSFLERKFAALLAGDVRAGILLSGGVESVLVLQAMLASRRGPEGLSAVTYDVFGGGQSHDSRAVREICCRHDLPLSLLSATVQELRVEAPNVVGHMPEPSGDVGYVPASKMLDGVAGDVGVVVTGVGAEALLRSVRTLGKLGSTMSSSAVRLHSRLLSGRWMALAVRATARLEPIYGLSSFVSILLDPERFQYSNRYGHPVPPAERGLLFDPSSSIPATRWLLNKSIDELTYVLPVFSHYVTVPDKAFRKIVDLASDREMSAFTPFWDESAFLSISPSLVEPLPTRVPDYRILKDVAFRLVERLGDADLVVTRKAALAVDRAILPDLSMSLAGDEEVAELLLECGVAGSARQASSIVGSLDIKQRYSAAVLAHWVREHRRKS